MPHRLEDRKGAKGPVRFFKGGPADHHNTVLLPDPATPTVEVPQQMDDGGAPSGTVKVFRFCSLIAGSDVKLSAIILAGSTVLSAVGASPPHDGIG